MNKNIMKLVLPAIIAGIGLTNTGCVATRCYETYPATRIETTYVTTPVVETVYVEHPVVRTIHTPPPPPPRLNVAPPRKPAPRPQVKPMAKAKPIPKAKTVAKAKPAPKAKPAQPREQAKATPRQKPTARPNDKGVSTAQQGRIDGSPGGGQTRSTESAKSVNRVDKVGRPRLVNRSTEAPPVGQPSRPSRSTEIAKGVG